MKIVLATGIYPPAIGGPATYVHKIAREFTAAGHSVIVITYGDVQGSGSWKIVSISRSGSTLARWKKYARALQEHGSDADVIFVFTSVSAGIPLLMSGVKRPKKILRLGGDFFWERYTDAGGRKSLRQWYASPFGFWRLLNTAFMEAILRQFDMVVYSTEFQRDIHRKAYDLLPDMVVHNARPAGSAISHQAHSPLKLLFMGRFVRFKNLATLIEATVKLPNALLTLVGDGPMKNELVSYVSSLGLQERVTVQPVASGASKERIFSEHDLLVLPSVTEISPNVALEAVADGLPVLLTEETGLKDIAGIVTKPLKTPDDIAKAVEECRSHYPTFTSESSRTYQTVARDLLELLPSS